jgi:hypothetical protein
MDGIAPPKIDNIVSSFLKVISNSLIISCIYTSTVMSANAKKSKDVEIRPDPDNEYESLLDDALAAHRNDLNECDLDSGSDDGFDRKKGKHSRKDDEEDDNNH